MDELDVTPLLPPPGPELGSLLTQRSRVFRHHADGHELTFKAIGATYINLEVLPEQEKILSAMWDDDYEELGAGVWCVTCGKWIASFDTVDE